MHAKEDPTMRDALLKAGLTGPPPAGVPRLILNLNGHRLSILAREALRRRYGAIEVKDLPVAMAEPPELERQVRDRLVEHLTPALDGQPDPILVLPNQVLIAAVALAVYHGLIGSFPTVPNLVYRPDQGIHELRGVIPLEAIRRRMRHARDGHLQPQP